LDAAGGFRYPWAKMTIGGNGGLSARSTGVGWTWSSLTWASCSGSSWSWSCCSWSTWCSLASSAVTD